MIVVALAAFGLQTGHAADLSTRERQPFNSDWRFQKDEASGTNDEQRTDLDDHEWRRLNLPHDWGIEGPFDQDYPGETGKLPWWGIGWYRKHFTVPAADKGKRIYLDIDGAMSYARVWLNGQFVGEWPYGYASFELDLTPYIVYGGENVVAVRLDNPKESSRWYPGGGIYRNVWLVKTAPVHVAHWGTYVTTTGSEVNVATTLRNDSDQPATCRLVSTTAGSKAVEDGIALDPGQERVITQKLTLKNPKVWTLKEPNLYKLVISIEQTGKTVDRYETDFGFRTIEFTTDRGFLLNGQRVLIKGVCDHHDLGALGAAINTRALERQIEILKEMGCNAIRTSHNPPAPELLELCDRMGMLVMDEFADCWRQRKKPNGYNRLFDEWSERDLRALIHRDRNHPCVVLWSIGNEIGEQRNPAGQDVSRQLAAIVHEEDATRPVTAACNFTEAGYNGFQKTLDVFGYNYKPGEYKKFREANPGIPVFSSESASTISSRGEYVFPVSDKKDDGKADFQMSSYDLYAPRWATTPDAEFKGQDQNPFVAGEFVWTGFDYLGEPTPYNSDMTNLLNFQDPAEKARAEQELKELGKIPVPSRSSYFGIIDLAGFKKDRFYIYQARWRPRLPMAHILPHWNWPGRVGEITPVHVYTSGDEAELFLNGRSLGRKLKKPFEYRLRWDDVKYEPGVLRVVAYKDGEKWAEDTVKTTGPAAQILMEPDRAKLKADGQDLAFVTVTVADANGRLVPRSKNLLQFEVTGPAEIIATDNGDATSHESFQAKERKAYNGLCLVILRTKPGVPGKIVLHAKSNELKSTQSILRSAL
jgi:beta-galactosidase